MVQVGHGHVRVAIASPWRGPATTCRNPPRFGEPLGKSTLVRRITGELDVPEKRPLKVVLLGSAPLLIAQGLTESLAGRFEILRMAA